MKRQYRMRPGNGNDVIYERKSWWFCWVPSFLGIGFYPYANAASGRNRSVEKLNKLAQDIIKEADTYAASESVISDEWYELKNKETVDRYGISELEYLDDKFIKPMLPFKKYVKEDFREVILKKVIDRALKDHKVDPNSYKGKSSNNGKVDMVITSKDGLDNFDMDHARHVVAYEKDKEKKKTNGATSHLLVAPISESTHPTARSIPTSSLPFLE